MKICNIVLLFILTCLAAPSFALDDDLANHHQDDEKTVVEEQDHEQHQSMHSNSLISLYRPNYVMPFYHTGSPYQSIYQGETPNNQKIQKEEFKAQLSFILPLYRTEIFHTPISLATAYTQLMYWQFYAQSQYFRETNYEPELFLQGPINRCSGWQIGLNHQSNGRGGMLERSWNRVYGEYAFSSQNWLAKIRLWTLFAKAESSNIHNPDIAKFLGHDNILLSYNWNKLNGSVMVQNLERINRYGFVEASLSYPVLPKVLLYGQFFHGYGQSLIEYNHKTTSFGVGVAIKDWVND